MYGLNETEICLTACKGGQGRLKYWLERDVSNCSLKGFARSRYISSPVSDPPTASKH